MVSAPRAARRLLRHAGVRRADARGAARARRTPVVGVVTQPDRPRGRGQKTTRRAGEGARARRRRCRCCSRHALKDPAFVGRARRASAPTSASSPPTARSCPTPCSPCRALGMINVHASLLPRYRGAAPVHRAVIAGERETGVTIMRVVKALDAGPMLATARRPIGRDETSDEVERDLARLGARAARRDARSRWRAGRSPETPQDDAQATYAPRLTQGRRRRRLDAAGRRASTTRSAACIPGRTRSRSSTAQRAHPAAVASVAPSAPDAAPPGTDRRAPTATSCASRPATGALRAHSSCRPKAGGRCGRASSSPAIALDAGRPLRAGP